MSSLYSETAVSGIEFLRARLVEIHNQQDVNPHISFLEEQVTKLGSNIYRKDTETLRIDYNTNTEIELIDPRSQAATGAVITHAQVMVILYSLYRTAAKTRDLKTAPTVVLQEIIIPSIKEDLNGGL